MGRKRQADAIRDAKGDPGKRAPLKAKTAKAAPAAGLPAEKGSTLPIPGTRPTTPKPDDLAVPQKVPGGMPPEMTKAGKRFWHMVVPLLVKLSFFDPLDRISLTRYCDTVAEYWKVTRELREKDYTYEAEKVGSGKMLHFSPLFMVQARHSLVSVRGATQSPLISASFSGVTLSPGAFPPGLPVSLSHRKTAPGFRFAGVVADAVRADAPSLSR